MKHPDSSLTNDLEYQKSRGRVYNILKQKLAALVGANLNDIKDTIPLSEVGLDSFLADELQNWINSTFLISTKISDILDSPHFSSLVDLVTTKSLLPKEITIQTNGNPSTETKLYSRSERPKTEVTQLNKLPKLPLPTLDSTLNTYLSSIEALSTKDEFANTERVVADFLKPGSTGRKLQKRLEERRDNPEIDCWLIDLYNDSNFLGRNTALAPFGSFFYTHRLGSFHHGQAERAAIITVAARNFKDLYAAGKIKPEQLNGQDTCMSSFEWLFNTHRKPCIGLDRMEKFDDENYIVVLRRGRVFKVSLKDKDEYIPYGKLKATFEAILQSVEDDISWVSILTADNRDSWAKIRIKLEDISAENLKTLQVIEAASFLVCLDDENPSTSAQRAYHFHFGNGSNRWWDKGMQFAICSNGISGQIVEHAMIDASTVYPLNMFMTHQIMTHTPDRSSVSPNSTDDISLEEYKFVKNEEIDSHIDEVRRVYQESCAGYEHRFLDYTGMGASLPRQKRFPLKSTFQIAVALASRIYFGYNPAFWDGVSLGSFYRGRVEINQVTLPAIVAFCNSVCNESVPPSQQRKLLYNATKTHANSVTRAVRGRGFDRHMTSLKQMLKEDEQVPELYTDPVYLKSRPRKIMSHCHDTGMLEKGFALRDVDAVWVHFEVQDDRTNRQNGSL